MVVIAGLVLNLGEAVSGRRPRAAPFPNATNSHDLTHRREQDALLEFRSDRSSSSLQPEWLPELSLENIWTSNYLDSIHPRQRRSHELQSYRPQWQIACNPPAKSVVSHRRFWRTNEGDDHQSLAHGELEPNDRAFAETSFPTRVSIVAVTGSTRLA